MPADVETPCLVLKWLEMGNYARGLFHEKFSSGRGLGWQFLIPLWAKFTCSDMGVKFRYLTLPTLPPKEVWIDYWLIKIIPILKLIINFGAKNKTNLRTEEMSPDGPYMVSRDKTEPGPHFLKELSNYTVRHVKLNWIELDLIKSYWIELSYTVKHAKLNCKHCDDHLILLTETRMSVDNVCFKIWKLRKLRY